MILLLNLDDDLLELKMNNR